MAPSIRQQQRSCSSKVESDYTRAREVCSSSTIAGLVGSHHRATNEEREALGRQDSVTRNLRRYVNNFFLISV